MMTTAKFELLIDTADENIAAIQKFFEDAYRGRLSILYMTISSEWHQRSWEANHANQQVVQGELAKVTRAGIPFLYLDDYDPDFTWEEKNDEGETIYCMEGESTTYRCENPDVMINDVWQCSDIDWAAELVTYPEIQRQVL